MDNVMKIASEAGEKMPVVYYLRAREFSFIWDTIEPGNSTSLFNAIVLAYNYGFAKGERCEKNRQRRERGII